MDLPAFWALDPLLKTHVKIFTADIERLSNIPDYHEQFPDLYKFDTRIISNVEIAGTIVGLEQNNTMIIYTVDDGFGTIPCCNWAVRTYAEPEFELGQSVRVLGRISDYKNQRQINIHEIYRMVDYNMEILHWLQTIRLRESVYSKPFDIPKDILAHKDELVAMLKTMDQDMIMESEDSQTQEEDIEIPDEQAFLDTLYKYIEDLAVDGKIEYRAIPRLPAIQKIARQYLTNSIPAASIDYNKIKLAIRQAFATLCADGSLFVVDAENDIYEIVRLDGQLRELILSIIRDVHVDQHDIHHGGVTGAYITTKVKEDSRFESISWSKVFEALQLLVLESIIYQVNPHEYSLIQ
ncbi:hypothetical protein K450DRAFT_221466 [Umbelopsis ramanniana AG]|uniref:CST complex subunit STN1 n=1 Tax=Umbelopsis ramanniana AG TaxID=1314678 RepID=A0AAD5EGW5_UMBRA|nr:uncharacterized protein K450DRAFT_221466 [Umbelopsis ramanniana AG]KAI8583493.1 hypothetical protein K450DRAFT_221466 [Umbelopsis ramanniana AG]